MEEEFDLNNWARIKMSLKKKYPQLTDADLIWRHETKDDFLKMISSKLGKAKNEFIAEIEKL
jgi:hypothetical protein